MANDNPHLTITLTGRPPVKVTKEQWPVLASAGDSWHDGQVECQANRKASWKLTVRQHTDGRSIVYGVHDYETHWQNEQGHNVRGGEVLDAGADIPEAIRRVSAELEGRLSDQGPWGQGVFPRLAHECTADLPAVEI